MNTEDDVARLVMLLVGAGWKRERIHDLIRSLHRVNRYEVDRLVDFLSSIERDLRRLPSMDSTDAFHTAAQLENEEIGHRVQLLLREAGLTNEDAVKEMTLRLREIDRVKAKHVPSYSKTSLASWVDRLVGLYSPTELLHVASVIRNERVHSLPLDWVLRKS